MARITVEDCLKRENNRFALVFLASKRAKQLLNGARVVVGGERGNKAVVTALREIAAGTVRFMTEQERADAALAGEPVGDETVVPQSAFDLASIRDQLENEVANGGGVAIPANGDATGSAGDSGGGTDGDGGDQGF